MGKIIIADNQDISNLGIQCVCIRRGLGFVCVKKREDLISCLRKYPDSAVIIDYSLFDISVEDLIILQERYVDSQWLLFSEDLNEESIRRMIFKGERISIVMKDSTMEEIETSIQYICVSRKYICQSIQSLLRQPHAHYEFTEKKELTPSEQEILKMIALGKTTKEIAAERNSSIHTITTHRKNIFRKIGVNNAHEATKYALRAGIIDEAEYYI